MGDKLNRSVYCVCSSLLSIKEYFILNSLNFSFFLQSGGETFLRYLKGVEYTGLTGEILFDDNGHRTDFKLDLIEKKRDNMMKTGTWYPESGVNYTVTVEEGEAMVVKQLQNMTLRVVTVTVSIVIF